MSDEAWEVVISAKENVVKIINISAENIDKESDSLELTKAIMEQWVKLNPTPIKTAISFIKKEINFVIG